MVTGSSIITILSEFAKSAGYDILKTGVTTIIPKSIPGTLYHAKRKYFKQLHGLLKEMPFIYKDIELEVLSNFQDISILRIPNQELILTTTSNLDLNFQREKFDYFNEYKKILLVGNAGMGKSTLFRYIVLNILKKKKIRYLNFTKNYLPIFIPLKAINNQSKSPILSYILSEIDLFKNKKGKKRFQEFLKKEEIVLLLDGYDEIGSASKQNFIQYELNILMSGKLDKTELDSEKVDISYYEYYKGLFKCKTWLSTREEFYRLKPLQNFKEPLRGSTFGDIPKYFAALKIKGLDNNREAFAKSIFDKYKQRSKQFYELLDEENFIEDIDTSNDKDLLDFSRTPLFLTILSYIYVEKIRISNQIITNWNMTLEELITECTKTLLNDIDEFKVRNLTHAKKIAFLRRRNKYQDEKTNFLQFFSYSLLSEKVSVFDYTYLKTKALIFFDANGQKEINQEIQNSVSNNPNILEQLLFSGLFTVAGLIQKEILYDFPHRRFREIYALQYLRKEKTFSAFIESINDSNLSEFVSLVYQYIPDLRDNIVEALITKLTVKETSVYTNNLLNYCIEKWGIPTNFINLFENNIINWIDDNKLPYISINNFKSINFSSSFILLLKSKLENVKIEFLNSVKLIYTILSTFDEVYLKKYLLQELKKKTTPKNFEIYTLNVLTFIELLPNNIVILNSKLDDEELQKQLFLKANPKIKFFYRRNSEELQNLSSDEIVSIFVNKTLRKELPEDSGIEYCIIQDLNIISKLSYENIHKILTSEAVPSIDGTEIFKFILQNDFIEALPLNLLNEYKLNDSNKSKIIQNKIEIYLLKNGIQLPKLLDLNLFSYLVAIKNYLENNNFIATIPFNQLITSTIKNLESNPISDTINISNLFYNFYAKVDFELVAQNAIYSYISHIREFIILKSFNEYKNSEQFKEIEKFYVPQKNSTVIEKAKVKRELLLDKLIDGKQRLEKVYSFLNSLTDKKFNDCKELLNKEYKKDYLNTIIIDTKISNE